jgi:uncharacterized protein YndB with AHSA1/START domain
VKRTFSSVTKIRAPREVVWQVMSDHARYVEWTSARAVTIERQGVPAPNGTGAIRVFHAGPSRVREEVVEWEPPSRLVYRVVSGLPVRGYRSEMLLDQDGDVSVLTWSSEFVPRVPCTGTFFTRLMSRAVDRFAAGIKAAAEEAATGP